MALLMDIVREIHGFAKAMDFSKQYPSAKPWISQSNIHHQSHGFLGQYPSAKPWISQTISISKAMDFSDNIHQQSHGFLKAISISKATKVQMYYCCFLM
jgi:hypothetical protein